jgi:hypothetical protein
LRLLDERRDLILVTMRDGARSWPATGHEWFAEWVRDRERRGEIVLDDAPATAVVLLGALANYWLNSRGRIDPVLGVDEDRFVAS